MQYNHVPKDFFFGGGGEILREMNDQDHQTSMAMISVSLYSIWPRSLRFSEGMGKKQYSITIVYGINNTSSKIIKIQNNEFSDRPRKCAHC